MINKLFYITICILLPLSSASSNFLDDKLDDDQCFVCHKELELLPDGFSENDVHLRAEISCAGCHGGNYTEVDEEKAMSKKEGFVGVPSRKEIPEFCGKCHSNINYMREFQPRIATDQVIQYYTSIHGKKIKEGNDDVAECVSCHSSHSILSAKDPRSTVYALNIPSTCNNCHGDSVLMDKYKLKSNQYELFAESVHGNALLNEKDVGAPACNDCHGNHGAVPPGVQSVSHVCGLCHVNNMEFFNQTEMSKVFNEMGFHGCEQCHGYHDVKKTNDKMIGVTEESICLDCHDIGDEGYAAADKISQSLTSLSSLYDSAKVLSTEVQIIGMNNIEAEFLLKDTKQNLIQSRTLVHTFDSKKVDDKIKIGMNLGNQALVLAEAEIDEYYSRRIGFGVATLLFLLLAVGMYFKIRSISKRNSEG